MRHKLLFLLLPLLMALGARAQFIQQEGFANAPGTAGSQVDAANTTSYTTTVTGTASNSVATKQYFVRTLNGNPPTDATPSTASNVIGFTPATGVPAGGTFPTTDNYFWSGEAVQGPANVNNRTPGIVQLNSVSIAGYANLQVKVGLFTVRTETTRWEKEDKFEVQVSFDGSSTWNTVGRIMGDNTDNSADINASGQWRQDADLDGTSADDAALATPSPVVGTPMSDFTFPVTGSGSTIRVRIMVTENGLSEEFAFDNIRLLGTLNSSAPPVLAGLETATLNYAEGAGPVQITNSITVSDADNTTLSGAVVRLLNYDATEDELLFTNQNGITATPFNTGTLTLSGTATLAAYEAALRSIQYRNNDVDDARDGTRTAQFSVTDAAGAGSGLVTRDILITSSLDAASTPNYLDDLTTNGEGTRYKSNSFVVANSGIAFFRTNIANNEANGPFHQNGVATTTFTNISSSFYWYSAGTGLPSNPSTVKVGTFVTKRINAASYANLHFKLLMGATTDSWDAGDYSKLYYRLNGGAWTIFASFRSTDQTTTSSTIGDLAQDANPNNLSSAPTGTVLGPALQQFDFTLPTAVNGQQVDFMIESLTNDSNNNGEVFVFDKIEVTGSPQTTVNSIVRASANPTNAATVNYTVTFGAAVTGVTASNFSLTPTGSLSGYSVGTPVQGSGNTWTVPVTTGTGNGTLTLNLANDTNLSYDISTTLPFAGETYTIDKTAPAAPVVTAPANGSILNTATPTYTGTAEANSTVTVFVDGTPLSGTVTANGSGAWSKAQPTALAQGSHTVYARATDAAGNTSANSATNTFTVDTTAPTVTITSSTAANGGNSSSATFTYTLTFSETVNNFIQGDVTVTNGNITGFSNSGNVYTVTVAPIANGAVNVSVAAGVAQDAAGNNNVVSTPNPYSIIYAAPTATVTSINKLAPTAAQSATGTATTQVQFTVTFSAAVSGVTASNFSLTQTTSGASITSVSPATGASATYTVVVNTGTGNGTLQLNVANATGITPSVTNTPFSGTSAVYTITKSFAAAPTLRIQAGGSNSGNSDVTAFVDVVQVLQSGTSTVVANGLQNGSFETNNVDPSSFRKATDAVVVVAAPWSFTGTSGVARNGSAFGSTAYSGDAVALVQSVGGDNNASLSQNLAVPTGSYQVNFQTAQRNYTSLDQRLNVFVNDVFVGSIQPNNTPNYEAFTSATFSVTAPALTATVSSTAAATGGTTATSPIPFAVSFSQSVGSSFTDADVTVANGTVTSGSFSGNGAGPYTFTVTPTTPGTATTVSLAAGVAQDANNTLNAASNAYSVTYNQPTTPSPSVTIPSNGATTNSTPTSLGSAVVGSTVRVYIDGVQVGTTVTPNSGGTWIRTYSGLPALTSGTHTVYATAQLPGQAVSLPSPTNTFTVQVPATYTSSAATQASTARVVAGSTNQAILQVAIVIGGGPDAPISATSFSFTTNGSTSPADIAAARVYYTGTSATFAATNQFGSATANPNGTFTIGGTRQLVNGTNYFWLVYDVASSATVGNVLDATAPSFTLFDGSFSSTRNPSTPDPAGNRQVVRISRVAGTALRFTGNTTAGYADFSASPTPAPLLNGSYTQAVWIKPAIGSGSTNYYVLGNGTGNAAAPYIYVSGNGRIGAGFGTGNATVNQQTGPNTVPANLWHHVVATYNGTTLLVYLNGEPVINASASGTPASTRVNFVGNVAAATSNNFPGDIDEVSQWTQALSQSEVRLLRHLTLSGTEAGLVSYLQFNETGTATTDGISGAAGTLTGATRVTSTAPVGAGVSNLQAVTGTGTYSFTGTNAAINFTSVSGAPYEVVVARLEGTPLGTPVTDPSLRNAHTRAYWVVNKYSTSSFTAAVTYTLDQNLISAGDAATPSNLKLYKRGSNSDAAFDAPILATAANAAASTVTFPVTSFSQTFIGTYGTSPLPVELARFTAERKGDDALLQWATAQELNNDRFEVESSTDGRQFGHIGTVAGQGRTTGRTDYRFADPKLLKYGTYLVYYRLRQVDRDGTFTYSPVRSVTLSGQPASGLVLVPNPARTTTLTGAQAGAVVDVYDALGRRVLTAAADAAGTAQLVLPAELASGVYVVRTGARSVRLLVE